MVDAPPFPRRIRSFVRREGRMTVAQTRALATLWKDFGIDAGDAQFDFKSLFGRAAPRILEIGFGMGDTLAHIAQDHPENDYLGIEVHRPGIGALLMKLERLGLSNVRVVCADAVEILRSNIPDAALDAIYIFFPDPWPKTRHHKRRLIQPEFVELLRPKLKAQGQLHLATDWENYAQHMLEVLSAVPGYRNLTGARQFAPKPNYRPTTKFEQRGRKLGHGVWDLLYARDA